jgi:hypothetical protein
LIFQRTGNKRRCLQAPPLFVLTTDSDRIKKQASGYFIPEFPRHITSITATPVSGGLPRE